MRKLMCFTIGFAAATAVGIYLLSGLWLALLGLFCLFAGVGLLFCKPKATKIIAMILLGAVAAFSWLWIYDHFYLSSARNVDTQTMELTVTASDYGFIPSYGEAFDGEVKLNGKTYKVCCYLQEKYGVEPGDRITGTFRLRYTAGGGASDPTYHQGKGIFLLAYSQEAITHEKATMPHWKYYPEFWRHRIQQTIENLFPDDTFAFAKALLLGDTNDFTYAQERSFQLSGIRHIVAVSGLHVAILFSLLYLFVGHNRFLVPLLGIPMLVVFAAISGFTPSIIRACVMQALISLGMLFQREYDPPTALSTAVLAILAANPVAITAVGFQLSVMCMVGIFLFSEKLRQYFLSFRNWQQKSKGKSWRARLIRWFTGSIAVSLSALVFTLPLCAIYFGVISLMGVLTNLLTLWIISFIFYGIILSCLAGLFLPALGSFLASLISWPIRYVLWLSGILADFPLTAVYTESVYMIAWLILSYGIVLVFFLTKRKHPLFTTFAIAGLFCLCLACSWVEPRLADTQIAVIDVDQGQSILLKSEDHWYLVDCGSTQPNLAAEKVANYLMSNGIFRLDGIILTHYDADHAGGVPYLLEDISAESIYMPDLYDSNGLRQIIESALPDTPVIIAGNTRLEIPGGEIHLIPAENPQSDNESSMCVLFRSGDCDILITGDRSTVGERMLLQQIPLPKLELLVVGHHGSHTATSYELLAATMPQVAVISVGENNYGHPRQEVLERLQQYGCAMYRTDLHGTIIFRR